MKYLFHPFTIILCVNLALKWVSYKEHIEDIRVFFFFNSISHPMSLIETFSPLAFKILMINMCLLTLCYSFSSICSSFENSWHNIHVIWGFPSGSVVKKMLAIQETWVWCLGLEDPVVEGRATHSSIFTWRIHGYGPQGHKEWDTAEATEHTCTCIYHLRWNYS